MVLQVRYSSLIMILLMKVTNITEHDQYVCHNYRDPFRYQVLGYSESEICDGHIITPCTTPCSSKSKEDRGVSSKQGGKLDSVIEPTPGMGRITCKEDSVPTKEKIKTKAASGGASTSEALLLAAERERWWALHCAIPSCYWFCLHHLLVITLVNIVLYRLALSGATRNMRFAEFILIATTWMIQIRSTVERSSSVSLPIWHASSDWKCPSSRWNLLSTLLNNSTLHFEGTRICYIPYRVHTSSCSSELHSCINSMFLLH